MKRLLLALITLLGISVLPNTSFAQCTKDTDCKGDRICVGGRCVYDQPVERRAHRRYNRNFTPPPGGVDHKVKLGFGAAIMTGPAWYVLAATSMGGGTGSIADNFIMNVDLLLGLNIQRVNWNAWTGTWNKSNRGSIIGMGFRALIGKGGALFDIHLLKYRGRIGVFRYTGAIGLTVSSGGGGAVFDSQVGLGLGFDVSKNISINLDLLDLDMFIGSGGIAMFTNSMLGIGMRF